ncbi:MAG: hypothetical protein WAO19_01310 [Candidatus Kryptoniota bacterium]
MAFIFLPDKVKMSGRIWTKVGNNAAKSMSLVVIPIKLLALSNSQIIVN